MKRYSDIIYDRHAVCFGVPLFFYIGQCGEFGKFLILYCFILFDLKKPENPREETRIRDELN
jgi:hypothetical protein